jgi:MYXO-CTERM domain-containing protein
MLQTQAAFAYCRARSCQDDLSAGKICERDADSCIIEGDELYWGAPCLSFGVAKGQASAVGLTDREFEAIVEEAFDRWKSVDCGDGDGPGFEVQSVGAVSVDEVYYCPETSLNLSVWLLNEDWQDDSAILGFTHSTYAEDDAEVFDADVELNLERVMNELAGERTEEVLLSIVMHEAGHFLGLAHSDDERAVMAGSYSPRDLVGRPLTADDIEGVCEIFPPEDGPKQCSEPGVSEAALDWEACAEALEGEPVSGGCNVVAPKRSPSSSPWILLLGLGLLGRRRTRR